MGDLLVVMSDRGKISVDVHVDIIATPRRRSIVYHNTASPRRSYGSVVEPEAAAKVIVDELDGPRAEVTSVTGSREPSAGEEKQIAARVVHLGALLDAAREAGLTGYAAYRWDPDRPAEPCLVIAEVHVHAEGVENPVFVIARTRRISVSRVDLALRAIRAADARTRSMSSPA